MWFNHGIRGIQYIKPIFHQKPCSRWVANANKNEINNMKSTCPTRTDRNHIPQAHVGVHIRIGFVGVCVGSVGVRIGSARLFGYQHLVYVGRELLTTENLQIPHLRPKPSKRTHSRSGGI